MGGKITMIFVLFFIVGSVFGHIARFPGGIQGPYPRPPPPPFQIPGPSPFNPQQPRFRRDALLSPDPAGNFENCGDA